MGGERSRRQGLSFRPDAWQRSGGGGGGGRPCEPVRTSLAAAARTPARPRAPFLHTHPPMEMACSMALRLEMSSSRRATKVLTSLPGPSSSSAHSTCFFCARGAGGGGEGCVVCCRLQPAPTTVWRRSTQRSTHPYTQQVERDAAPTDGAPAARSGRAGTPGPGAPPC